MGGGRDASLVKVPVNKGTLLSEVRVATVRKCKSWECGWRGRCITCGSRCKVQESLSLGLGGVCRFSNESLFFYQSVCVVREVSSQYNTFKVTD